MKKTVSIIVMLLATVMLSAQGVSFHFTDGIYNEALKAKMEKNVAALLTEINEASAQGRALHLTGLISPEGAQGLLNIWKTFGFACGSEAQSICYGLMQGYQARNIQATITRQPEDFNGPKTRELAITFNKSGTITKVIFANPNNRLSVPHSASQVLDARRRNEILKFVEDFRNYYIEKDLASLRKIYSEDALIITGKTLMTRTEGDNRKSGQSRTTYTVQDKETYLRNLATLFKWNKSLDVQFEDIMISDANSEAMPNYYGVNLIQHWTGINKSGKIYQDTGYLFLLWDFNEEPPVIHVRAWQPQKGTSDNDIMTIDDFR